VLSVDVGYGQLLWRLQNDDRVTVLDRTNIRTINPEMTNGLCDGMVGDLSFISLKLVLPAIVECMKDGAWLLPMVKPQFEVGKDRIGSGGGGVLWGGGAPGCGGPPHITFEPLVPRVLHAILSRGVWHRLFVPQVA